MKTYAGIGSRETPPPILDVMKQTAVALADNRMLRTGGASGADTAFTKGAMGWCKVKNYSYSSRIKVYLPWRGFGGFDPDKHDFCTDIIPEEAFDIAKDFHPAYNKLSDSAKSLMARNSLQVLGDSLDDPVEFIICYTPDGLASGGTGQAIRIAEDMNIEVHNLYHVKTYRWCMSLIEQFKKKEKVKWEEAYLDLTND